MVAALERGRSGWGIVPYEDPKSFKRVRIRDEGRIEAILRHCLKNDYVVVLGAPFSEKTLLLQDVREAMQATGLFATAYIDLWQARSDDETAFFTSMARLIGRANDRLFAGPAEALTGARAFQTYLETCLAGSDRHLMLLIDHLQALPQDLVRSLLRALRSTFMERRIDAPWHVGAVVAGAVNLAGLATGPTSPFNMARSVFVRPLTPEQSWVLAEATLRAYGMRCSVHAIERIGDWVGGDSWLIPRLCAWSAEAVQGYRRPAVTRAVVERAAQRLVTEEAQAPIREAIQIIEDDLDTLLDVLYLLDHERLPRRQARQLASRTGIDRLQLSGAVALHPDGYRIKNRAFSEALRRHFTPGQVGYVLRMRGRWQAAIDYLAPRLSSDLQLHAKGDLLEAIVQAINAAESLDEAYRILVDGLLRGFELPNVHIYRADASRRELQLVCSSAPETGARSTIELDSAESVEAQAFLAGDNAVRRSEEGVRLIAAMVPERRPIGVLTIEHYPYHPSSSEGHAPSPQMAELLHFVRHAAGAIENVMLRSAYQEIGRAVLDAKAPEPTLDRVLRVVANAVGADVAALYLLDATHSWLQIAGDTGAALRPAAAGREPVGCASPHPAARCLREQEIVVTSAGSRAGAGEPWAASAAAAQLAAFVPLSAGGSQLGALEIAYHDGHHGALNDEDRRALAGFADQVAIAVYNLQLLRRTDEALVRRVAEAEKLRDTILAITVSSTLDLDAVLARIIQHVQALFPGTESTIWERVAGTNELRVLQSSIGDPAYRDQRLAPDSATGQAIASGRARIVPDFNALPPSGPRDQALRLGLAGLIAIPLVSHERVLGAVEVYHRTGDTFSPEEQELLAAFAAPAAIAIDNAQQYQALEQAKAELEDTREREMFDLGYALLHRIGNMVGDVPYQLARIRSRAGSGADLAGPIEHISQRAASLSDLIEPLTALIELPRMASARLDLRRVARESRGRALACQGTACLLDLPPLPVWVDGNLALLCDAVQSLLENACEATGGAGSIQVRLLPVSEHWVELAVQDNGPGVPPEVVPRMFEPGFSTKSTPGHERGKGLFTCAAIVRKHRGSIHYEPTPGGGATFVITLPLIVADTAERPAAA